MYFIVFAMNLQREHEEAKERVKDIKERAKRLLQIAKKATGTADGENLSQEIRMVSICVRAKKYAEVLSSCTAILVTSHPFNNIHIVLLEGIVQVE